jgi:hypothetical protein
MNRREWIRTLPPLGAWAALGAVGGGAAVLSRPALAHHGWSSFDQQRPIYLEGRAKSVAWRNPHAEMVLERAEDLRLPADLASRSLPAQRAGIDGPALLRAAQLPTRTDREWQVELAPLSRMNQWQVPEIRVGDPLALLGFTFIEERGDPIVRVEYLFLGDRVYGMRSAPA